MKTISAREFRDASKKYYKEALKQTVILRLQGGVGLKLVPVKLKPTLTLEEEEGTPNTLKEGEKPLEVTEPNSETTQEPTNEVPKQEIQQEESKEGGSRRACAMILRFLLKNQRDGKRRKGKNYEKGK